MKNSVLPILLFALFIGACQPAPPTEEAAAGDKNPAAEGFLAAESDSSAVAIADEVMKAMGGRRAWDETRFLEWNFFGARKHCWDKHTGRVRIESERDDFTLLMNIHTGEGKVRKGGEELTHPDSLSKYLRLGKEAWINDSYWLVMPFKLKDSGVRLKYARRDSTADGRPADVLDLTFRSVGVTPDNRYEIFVDREERLVKQWRFFNHTADSSARFTTPWDGYSQHGKILLSGGRGQYELTEIAVRDTLPDALFESFDRVADN